MLAPSIPKLYVMPIMVEGKNAISIPNMNTNKIKIAKSVFKIDFKIILSVLTIITPHCIYIILAHSKEKINCMKQNIWVCFSGFFNIMDYETFFHEKKLKKYLF